MILQIKNETKEAVEELISTANLKEGNLLVVGCSTSEIIGEKIGTSSSKEVAEVVYESIIEVTMSKGIFVAAQCCEHLNRAIIVENEYVKQNRLENEMVNVIPIPKAGGSFAATAFEKMKAPCALEHIKADAGIDIGDTLIGMHLKEVAVPVRLKEKYIGHARLCAARTRLKFIGGCRAFYGEKDIR